MCCKLTPQSEQELAQQKLAVDTGLDGHCQHQMVPPQTRTVWTVWIWRSSYGYGACPVRIFRCMVSPVLKLDLQLGNIQ